MLITSGSLRVKQFSQIFSQFTQSFIAPSNERLNSLFIRRNSELSNFIAIQC